MISESEVLLMSSTAQDDTVRTQENRFDQTERHVAKGSSSSLAGALFTETLSFDSGGGRKVSVYIPPGPPEAVVFTGDGQLLSQWAEELEAHAVTHDTKLPSTVLVGVHRAEDEMVRLQEYSPSFNSDRFLAHERFFVEDVRQWLHSHFNISPLPTQRTAVFGVSAGGELALAMGLKHPDVYGVVLCASPGGGYQPPVPMPSSLPRFYLLAGTLEPFFLKNATRWAEALRGAGADIVMSERVGSHGGKFWREEFPLMLAWAFAR